MSFPDWAVALIVAPFIIVAILLEKQRNQWIKAAQEWRALAQQYSNAAMAERIARIDLERSLTTEIQGEDASAPQEQPRIH